MKYSPSGTHIVLAAERVSVSNALEHSWVKLSVRDYGPGIPEDEQQLLFGKFVRLQRDLSGEKRGTGLGLYISEQLVERMGGRIWVESSGAPGEGSTFSVLLPVAL